MLAPTPFNGDDDEEDDDDDDDDDEDDYGGGIMTLILMCKWEANLCRYPYCGSSCKFISTDAGTHTFQWSDDDDEEEEEEEEEEEDDEDGDEVDDYNTDNDGGVYYDDVQLRSKSSRISVLQFKLQVYLH